MRTVGFTLVLCSKYMYLNSEKRAFQNMCLSAEETPVWRGVDENSRLHTSLGLIDEGQTTKATSRGAPHLPLWYI